MTSTHPRGTRGHRQPRGPLLRLVNRIVAARVRRGGRVLGQRLLVLVTVGRRTGREHATPLYWFEGDNGTWLVVASAAGAPRNPAWYANLAAAPDRAVVEVAGWCTPVVATELHGEERARAWEAITRENRRYAAYQQQTDRRLPVIRLTPRYAPVAPVPGEGVGQGPDPA